MVTTLIPSTIVFTDGAAVTKQIGSGAYTNTVSGIGDGAVTYGSGTPTTATVDTNTGAITLVAAGTTIITATRAATATYAAVANTYTLTIIKIPSTIVFADGATVTKQIGSGVYTNTVSGVGDGAVTYGSGTPGTATVDTNTGAITLVAAGTTIITATRAATASYLGVTNTYLLTVVGIGSWYNGGIIAYILVPADPGFVSAVPHGLIVSALDLGSSYTWALAAYKSTTVPAPGAAGLAIGKGLANTNAIVAQNGAGTSYAAGLCDAYTNPYYMGVYSDWYLPSGEELDKLYINRVAIGMTYPYVYWSSSEYDGTDAWIEDFSNGHVSAALKWSSSYDYTVRAVRSF
jgi:predicted regulator of Ras-like GTPase activity (Roadblock/LC7/MglB family)